jgi:hypothetical protein
MWRGADIIFVRFLIITLELNFYGLILMLCISWMHQHVEDQTPPKLWTFWTSLSPNSLVTICMSIESHYQWFTLFVYQNIGFLSTLILSFIFFVPKVHSLSLFINLIIRLSSSIETLFLNENISHYHKISKTFDLNSKLMLFIYNFSKETPFLDPNQEFQFFNFLK